MGEDILFRIHKSYRWVVAVCDKELYGKKLIEDKAQLDLTGEFFNGEVLGSEETKRRMIDANKEDATFNIVGEKSVSIAKELGFIKEEGILEVQGVPFALVLL
jgi:uncharacterized protein